MKNNSSSPRLSPVKEPDVAKRKKLKMKEGLDNLNLSRAPSALPFRKTDSESENGKHDRNDKQDLTVDTEDQNNDKLNTNAAEFSASEVWGPSQSVYVGYNSEDVNEAILTDVQLTFNASCRDERVPLVSLTSKLTGVSIIGYPIEVGEISDSSESGGGDAKASKVHQLVWRTSKRTRTPVCYVTNSLSSISKDSKAGKWSKNADNSIPLSRENGVLMKERSLEKFLKNPCKFKRGRAAPKITCVPVGHIFSNILAAVGGYNFKLKATSFMADIRNK